MPMPVQKDFNLDKAVQVLVRIERDPQAHEQGPWITPTFMQLGAYHRGETITPDCGTAFCFAGTVAALEGLKWTDRTRVVLPNGDSPQILDYACKQLGIDRQVEVPLTLSEMPRLFCATNTKDDLYRIVGEYAGVEERVVREKVAAEL